MKLRRKPAQDKMYPLESRLSDKEWEIRLAAENDLLTFIRLVAPYRVLGHVHKELLQFWQRQDATSHQLTLLPRDHQKSAMIAFRVAQRIVKYPEVRIGYLSSTSTLAEAQLKMIKDILTTDVVQRYWPDLIHPEEGKRERWTNSEIIVDHPKRKEEGVRDSTVFTGGLTTSLTGLHCDIGVYDDIVVQENAYTGEGRKKVKMQYSLLASIESTDAEEWVVGTRYHPSDLYQDLIDMAEEIYDEEGNVVGTTPVFEVFERKVEDKGDGTGQFLWPRQKREDGKWFGFDRQILAKKRAQYLDRNQFYAQYYNDPNDPEGSGIPTEKFQYYDRKFLSRSNGNWYFKGNKLNVYGAIDFAFSLQRTADYTAIVVVGIDYEGNIFVLDIDRFRTDAKISDYFKHIMDMHIKWDLKKLRAEANVAQKSIVQELKNSYIKPNGITLSIDEHVPTKAQGTKEERINAVLEPRYDMGAIWHFEGGHCQTLEEELTVGRPPHDDVKDALASAIEIAVPPMGHRNRNIDKRNVVEFNSRFGGVAH